jgi:SAM-dependent methyltransferase
VSYGHLRRHVPGFVRRYLWHFETAIEDAVTEFAGALADKARVLDAGAGEGQYKRCFPRQRYTGVDLGIGDQAWNYGDLDTVADLAALPFRDGVFDACVNIVTLEHVTDPARVLCEMSRTLRPGGRLLLVAPHEWEEHQQPYDYFRYTRYGLRHLLEQAGFRDIEVQPVGGFFRLLGRRMLGALQFFRGPAALLWLLFFAPFGVVLPLLDPLDRTRHFTLGFISTAQKA